MEEFRSENADDENKKAEFKGHKMIRKKAWIDLLKRLSAMGLSARSNQKYSHLHDSKFVYQVSPVHFEVFADSLAKLTGKTFPVSSIQKKAEKYYHLSRSRLDVLKKTISKLSTDISQDEAQKSLSFLSHLLNISVEQRAVLDNSIRHVAQLRMMIGDIEYCTAPEEISGNPVYSKKILETIYSSLGRSLLLLNQTKKLHFNVKTPPQEDELVYSKLEGGLLSYRQIFKQLVDVHGHSPLHLQSATALVNILDLQSAIVEFRNLLQGLKDQSGLSTQLYDPLIQYIETLDSLIILETEISPVQDDQRTKSIHGIWDAVLKDFQLFKEYCIDASRTTDEQASVSDYHLVFLKAFSHSKAESLIQSITLLTENLNSRHQNSNLKFVFSILHQYVLFIHQQLYQSLVYHKTVVKLAYVLANTFMTIFKGGFHIPDAEEEGGEEGNEQTVDGMGIGEGQGQKDVSDEIEEQHQVEGLKGEESHDQQDKTIKEEENGLEMDEDFEGALDDLDEQSGEELDDEQKDELDEEMGDLDDDLASVLDEKLWGEDETTEEDKTEQDCILD